MKNKKRFHTEIRVAIRRSVLVCIGILMVSANSEARIIYQFINDPPIAIRATLELSKVPASIEDILRINFTPEGDVFGLGPSISGPFDSMSFSTIAETMPMNLGCTGCTVTGRNFAFKEAGYYSPVLGTEVFFVLGFENHAGGDSFGFVGTSPSVFSSQLFNGDWIRSVPEPSCCYLALSAMICLACNRYPRT